MTALSYFRTDGLLRLLTSLALQLLLQACKHPLAIVGEGDIVDLNDTGGTAARLSNTSQVNPPILKNSSFALCISKFSRYPYQSDTEEREDGSIRYITSRY